MTREKMIAAITEAVESLNYTLYTGMEYRINDFVKVFPSAWLTPSKLLKINGRERGSVVYAVAIHLMNSGKQLTENEKTVVWSRMEREAIDIYRKLSIHEDVTSVDDLQCVPAEFILSNHGEISLTMNFNLEIPFCSLIH